MYKPPNNFIMHSYFLYLNGYLHNIITLYNVIFVLFLIFLISFKRFWVGNSTDMVYCNTINLSLSLLVINLEQIYNNGARHIIIDLHGII